MDNRRRLVAALLLATGCAAALEATRRSPGTYADGKFTPARAAATNYGADPTRSCPKIPAVAAVADSLGREPGKNSPQPDGRLCAMAETLLGWQKLEVPEPLIAFLSWNYGVPAPVRRVEISKFPTGNFADVGDRLADTIRQFSATATQPRYGLTTDRIYGGARSKESDRAAEQSVATRFVLVLYDDVANLDPVPRKLATGAQATVSGTLAGDYTNPSVYISDAAGKLETPKAEKGKAFKAELKCEGKPGNMLVELHAEQSGAQSIVASFPVACGMDSPTAVALGDSIGAATAVSAAPVDPAQQEETLLTLINAERTAAGLKPLQKDEGVAKVARSISDTVRDDFAKGASPQAVDPVARLKAADISSALVLQNPGMATTAEAVQRGFASNAVNRSNYMNPEVTNAGIGISVVPPKDKDGRPLTVVTELFTKESAPVDTEQVRSEIYEAIAKKRATAKAAPLAKDATLDKVAQEYAKALADAHGKLERSKDSAIVTPLTHGYKSLNILGGARPAPLEVANDPSVVEGGKLVGVGVAQGTDAVLGKNAVYVVVFIGAKR